MSNRWPHGLTFTDKLQYACLGLAPLLCMIAAVFLFFAAASLFLAGHSSGEIKQPDGQYATESAIYGPPDSRYPVATDDIQDATEATYVK